MKKIAWGAVVAAMAISGTVAASGGDVTAGKIRAAACGACHGGVAGAGNPKFPDTSNPGSFKAIPSLAGQNEHYIIKQLRDFKSGKRKDALMTGQALSLKEQDMVNLGAYYASLDVPQIPVAATVAQKEKGTLTKEELLEKGKKLYSGGDIDRGISACKGCHGPEGLGNPAAGWPTLTGQHPGYTLSQLKMLRAQERQNDPNKMMRDVASRLTDQDMEAITAYLQGLGQ